MVTPSMERRTEAPNWYWQYNVSQMDNHNALAARMRVTPASTDVWFPPFQGFEHIWKWLYGIHPEDGAGEGTGSRYEELSRVKNGGDGREKKKPVAPPARIPTWADVAARNNQRAVRK